MKHFVWTTLLLGALPVLAQEEETQEFVLEAAVSNKFEIASSELALERARSQAVRDFAEHMIQDHEKATEELSAAVDESELGIGVPETLDDKHAELMQELGQAQGAEFDRKYVEMQVAAHDEAVRLFEDYVDGDATSDSVRAFAAKTLPVLEGHDRAVEQLSEEVAGR